MLAAARLGSADQAIDYTILQVALPMLCNVSMARMFRILASGDGLALAPNDKDKAVSCFVIGYNDHYNNNGHNCCVVYNRQQL